MKIMKAPEKKKVATKSKKATKIVIEKIDSGNKKLDSAIELMFKKKPSKD